jgi:protein-tyrosine-phosphatase
MREIGIDLSRHHSKRFEDRWDTAFDLLICLSPEAYEHGKALARTAAMDVEFWDIEDPTETTGNRNVRLDAYRRVRDSLLNRLQQRFGTGDGG